MQRFPPEVGARLGKGSFAVVYEAPGMPGFVLKRTTCAASVELLRELRETPQRGFPLVYKEVFEESDGAVWFLLEELSPVFRFDEDVGVVMQAMDDTYREVATGDRDSFEEGDISEMCAQRLQRAGFFSLAEAFQHLGYLLRTSIDAVLDIRLPNLMRNEDHLLILSDPICSY